MILFTRVQLLCSFNIVAPYLSPFAKSLEVFVDVPYWPPYSTDKFISWVVPGPSQWFFHFGEKIVIAWTHRVVRWIFRNLPFPVTQAVRDSSNGATPSIVMKNNGVLYHPSASRFPWKHSCVLWPRGTSILIQERCSSFVNMLLGARTISVKVSVLHTAVD